MNKEPSSSRARVLFAEAIERTRARPRLGNALLGVETNRYLLFRIRYLLPRVAFRTLLHSVELYLLATVVPWESLGPYFFLRGLTLVFGGVHFGWLEGLRARVRVLFRERRYGAVRAVTATWLMASALWGGIALLLSGVWVVFRADGYEGFSVFDAFAIACALRISVEALARTVHSMLYAVRRVRRPLSSLLLPDAIEPIGLLILFPTWGLWSFSFVALLGGLVRAYLTYAWTRASLVGTRLEGPIRLRKRAHTSEAEPFLRSLVPGISSLSAQVDALLLVVLAGLSEQALLPALYLARPLLAGVHGAMRTFYFDFKSIEYDTPTVLIRRFVRRLWIFSLLLGTAVGMLAFGSLVLVRGQAAFGAELLGGPIVGMALGLTGFGAARSLFALAQVTTFAREHHRKLVLVAVGLCGAVVVFSHTSNSVFVLLLGLTVAFGGAAVGLLLSHAPGEKFDAGHPLVMLIEAAATSGPAVIFSAAAHAGSLVPLGRVIHELKLVFPGAAVFRDGRTRLCGLVPSASLEVGDLRRALVKASAGLVREVQGERVARGSDWVAALRRGYEPSLSAHHRQMLSLARQREGRHPARVVEELVSAHPEVQAISLASTKDLEGVTPGARLSALAGLARTRRGGGVFAALFPGDTRHAYLLHADLTEENRVSLAQWKNKLQIEALRLALEGTIRPR